MSASGTSPNRVSASQTPTDAAGLPQPGTGLVACWSETGVYGSGACPELKKHVHCHHCPVFSSAGSRLLDRPLEADYRAERTTQFAVRRGETEVDTVSAMIFRTGGEWLGLPAAMLQEATERRPIHSLPHRRNGFIVGLANIRGELLVCISLAHLLGLPNSGSLDDVRRSCSRILVVHSDGIRSALPVDEVHGPFRFHSSSLRRLPELPNGARAACVRQMAEWNGRAVGLLEPDMLFSALNQPLA